MSISTCLGHSTTNFVWYGFGKVKYVCRGQKYRLDLVGNQK